MIITQFHEYWERISVMRGIYFIHVGKCGGSTIQTALEQTYNGRLMHCHCAKPKFIQGMQYVACIRSPLSRFVSAFNWRYYLLKSGKKHNPEELAGLEYFGTPNNLANALSDYSQRDKALKVFQFQQIGKKHPEHIQMGIGYYLSDFISIPGSMDRLQVVRQEYLNLDLKKVFEALELGLPPEIPKEKKGYSLLGSSIKLDDAAQRNLIEYYKDDYKVMEELSIAGLIDHKYVEDCRKYPFQKDSLK